MEEVKKKKKGGLVFCIFLVLIIISLVGYICVDKGYIKLEKVESNKTDKSSNKENTDSKESYEEIDIRDASILKLYDNAHYNWTIGSDQFVFNNKALSVSDMDINYKMGLAGNVFFGNMNVNYGTNTKTISYDDVRRGYEEVFGPNTFDLIEKFNLGCGDYIYNSSSKEYVNTTDGCGGATVDTEIEELISAKKYNDRIEIISAVMYLAGEENAIYRDYNHTNKIKDFGEVAQSTKQLAIYVSENSDYLEQYTYTFKLNDDGFYYYAGVERTQE